MVVLEPVLVKFGIGKKYQNRNRNNLVPEKSLGTGIGKIWYRKKYRYRYRLTFWVPSHTVTITITITTITIPMITITTITITTVTIIITMVSTIITTITIPMILSHPTPLQAAQIHFFNALPSVGLAIKCMYHF